MELFLDTGNLKEIKELNSILSIDGVTTNPTLVAKENKKTIQLLEEIYNIIGEDKIVHVQVISTDFEGMVEEARFLNNLYKNIHIKIPVTKEGFKAIKELSKEGIKITATAVFTPNQGFLAAKAGAKYVAPYVNRLDNISGDGINVVKDILTILKEYNFDCKVLGASFKNAQQVLNILKYGIQSITIPEDVAKALMDHPLTDYSVDKFVSDWERAFGKGVKTIE
ncbi:MAG: fructose-6-phosphate aldolase [Clostridiaceae bacterium]|nr:fructose-6-phosphate aldolase [Clostridiaceae bacterium]MBW4859699.1 fructose-6-phosphate aldolase [Clostridiaceae bacterium]MBW4868820.1 fructose-6-phosphate aldolase [Clostridiaceae bacterium]